MEMYNDMEWRHTKVMRIVDMSNEWYGMETSKCID